MKFHFTALKRVEEIDDKQGTKILQQIQQK